jgi:hypothetical protein
VYSHVFAELEDGTIDIEEGIARARRGDGEGRAVSVRGKMPKRGEYWRGQGRPRRRYISAFEPAPTLDQGEGRAPSARLGQLGLGLAA